MASNIEVASYDPKKVNFGDETARSLPALLRTL